MCISADQNGARLIKMAREEIGFQPRSKVILRHAQQDFDTIASGSDNTGKKSKAVF